jgi:molybdopterin biosynthesis enzyme
MAQRVLSPYRLVPVPEACDIILRECPEARREEVMFQESLGRVLAADVDAASALPPFPASCKARPGTDGLGKQAC